MAEIKYSVKYVLDKIEAKLPDTWTLFHFTSTPNKWTFSRGMKTVAFLYTMASGQKLSISIIDRKTLPRFKELAKIAEKHGYKVTIQVN